MREIKILTHKSDEFSTVWSELYTRQEGGMSGITVKQTRYPHTPENNLKHHEREVGNLSLARENNLPVVTLISNSPDQMKIVTEFFDGEPLKNLLQKQEINRERCAALIRKAFETLARFHLAGIIIFDPHLGNFLVNAQNDMVICDLGLSCSKKYSHLVPPPTSESSAHYSQRQNKAIAKSYQSGGDATLLNTVGPVDDIYVLASDILRNAPEGLLDEGDEDTLIKAQQGMFSSVPRLLAALPGYSSKQAQSSSWFSAGSAFRRLLWQTRYGVAVAALGAIGLSGVYLARIQPSSNHTSIQQAVNRTTEPDNAGIKQPDPAIAGENSGSSTPEVMPTIPQPQGIVPPSLGSNQDTASADTARQSAAEERVKTPKKQPVKNGANFMKAAKTDELKGRYAEAYRNYRVALKDGISCKAEINRLEKMTGRLLSDKENRASGFRLLRAIADASDKNRNAQYYTGLYLKKGYGVAPNSRLANHYLQLAARNGHIEAAKELRAGRKA